MLETGIGHYLAAGENSGCTGVMTPSHLLGSDARYDLVFNADSITEMIAPTARSFCEVIKVKANLFLPSNHETEPLTVRDHCAGIGMAAIICSPCRMRGGYVDTVIKPNLLAAQAGEANLPGGPTTPSLNAVS